MTSAIVSPAALSHRFSLRVAEGLWLVDTNDEQFAHTLCDGIVNSPGNWPHELWLRVQVVEAPAELEPAHFRGMGHVVICRYGANLFVFDLHRRRVDAVLSHRAAHQRDLWKATWLPLILGVMSCSIGVLPLHSACVVKDGQGLLIAGESMAGKSTLCVALAKDGFELLSDDWTYLRPSGDAFICCGMRVPIKLLPDAILHYPELGSFAPARTANGEIAYELPCHSLGVPHATTCLPAAMIFLERGASGDPSFLPADRAYVEQYVANSVDRLPPELSELENARRNAMQKMSTLPAWTFRYAGSPQLGAKTLANFFAENFEKQP